MNRWFRALARLWNHHNALPLSHSCADEAVEGKAAVLRNANGSHLGAQKFAPLARLCGREQAAGHSPGQPIHGGRASDTSSKRDRSGAGCDARSGGDNRLVTGWRTAAVAALSVFAISACGGGADESSQVAPQSPASGKATTATAVTDFTKFQAVQGEAIGESIWSAAIIHDESVLPISGKTNYTMLRDVVCVISVRNRQTGQTYTPGTDYTTTNGQFIIPAGSQIPMAPATFTSTPPDNYKYIAYRADGTPIRIASDYQMHQIAVTYEGKAYGGSMTSAIGASKLMAKLAAGQKVAITYTGDSITYGSDTTYELNVYPQQRGYAYLVASHLASLYPGQVYMRDRAVGGTTSWDGTANATAYLGDTPSDLVVIAFGMNDASQGVNTSEAAFENNLRTMVTAARAANPDCEILIVLSWPSNPEAVPLQWTPFSWYYTAANNVQANTPGIIIANVTSPTWGYMLSRKSFYDITANGFNHPSDWMHQFYAQVVLGAIQGMPVPN